MGVMWWKQIVSYYCAGELSSSSLHSIVGQTVVTMSNLHHVLRYYCCAEQWLSEADSGFQTKKGEGIYISLVLVKFKNTIPVHKMKVFFCLLLLILNRTQKP